MKREATSFLKKLAISVDYEMLELSQKAKVIPSLIEWSNLRSSDSVYDHMIITKYSSDEYVNIVTSKEINTSFI